MRGEAFHGMMSVATAAAHAARQEEAKLRASLQRDLVFITGELEMQRSFLNVVNGEHVENPVVRTLVRQLDEISKDVTDGIQLLVRYEEEQIAQSSYWFRVRQVLTLEPMLPPFGKARDAIEQLKARVADLSTRARNSLNSGTGSASVMPQLLLMPAEHSAYALFEKGSHTDEDKLVEDSFLDGHDSVMKRGCEPRHLSLHYLKDITNNFSDDQILGRGAFGVVYKGVLHNGKVIAVKKLNQPLSRSHGQFEKEVELLMKLKHTNIVRLVGYCYETQHLRMPYEGKSVFADSTEALLCLECLPNGSLDKYISDASSGLDWHTRYKIIEGISYGLRHLHEQYNGPIIHLDLKPANILLDENMLPKITDFGLSRLFDQNQTIISANTSGTLGYMPPEYLQRGIITPMSDIFSLGVIIMEVITGHRDYPYDISTSSQDYFIEIELRKWRNRFQEELGYASLETDCQQIERCIRIGLMCVNPERTKRPTMENFFDMLQV